MDMVTLSVANRDLYGRDKKVMGIKLQFATNRGQRVVPYKINQPCSHIAQSPGSKHYPFC